MENIEVILAVLTTIGGAIAWTFNFVDSNKAKSNLRESFDKTLQGLYSTSVDQKISSAILLRRFLNKMSKEGKHRDTYKIEAINVISSLLKKEKCGEYQKTLADSLSYILNLDKCDFQYANLQNMYLEPNETALKKDLRVIQWRPISWLFWWMKKPRVISMCETDMFMADLSYANIKLVSGKQAVFYKANLYQATFRNCDLSEADFRGAYLEGAKFKNCVISGIKIGDSYGNPVFDNCIGEISAESNNTENTVKKVFISCPGALTPKQAEFLSNLKTNFKQLGIEVIQFAKYKYRETGQLSAIKTEIANSNGVVILGFKDVKILEGRYRPNTEEFKLLNNDIIVSPWINIEAGIASGTNKPILMIFDERLNSGLFDDAITDHNITKVKINSVNYAIYDHQVDEWVRQIN